MVAERVTRHGRGRIYLSPVEWVAVGASGGPENVVRIRERAGVVGCRSTVATNPDGTAQFDWAICWVQATDWADIESEPAFVNLADLEADTAKLDRPLPNQIKVRLVNADIITRDKANAISTIRDLIRVLIQKHYGAGTDERTEFREVAE